MPLTLALDASTYAGSVAVLRGAQVIAERDAAMRDAAGDRLMPAVADALSASGADVARLERVVCGEGPGTFTSLRIAASIAKGIASARVIPLYAVSSLALIVAGHPLADGTYLAVLDAMRDEAYVQGFERVRGTVSPLAPHALIPRGAVRERAGALGAVVVGPAGSPARGPHARGVALLLDALAGATPTDLVSWEPRYGRLAEAQARWERAHGRPLPNG